MLCFPYRVENFLVLFPGKQINCSLRYAKTKKSIRFHVVFFLHLDNNYVSGENFVSMSYNVKFIILSLSIFMLSFLFFQNYFSVSIFQASLSFILINDSFIALADSELCICFASKLKSFIFVQGHFGVSTENGIIDSNLCII